LASSERQQEMKQSVGITVPANVLTEVFTVPSGYIADVSMLFVSNHTNGAKWVDVYWQHQHDAAHKIYILYQKSLSAKEFLQFSNGSVMLKEGDSMWIKSEAGSDYTIIVTMDLVKASPMFTFPNE
jgi:hypothetical protein